MGSLIAKHGGYEKLKSFQTTEIIYDLTVEFCLRYITSHKLKDQMEGAARSGSINIAEGSLASGTSKQTEIRLVDVARASQEELKRDFLTFLRQNNFKVWDKNNLQAREIRQLGYKTDRTNKTYATYMTSPESAANCLLCLINQACYLIDMQLKALGNDLKKNGDFKERYKEERKNQLLNDGPPMEEFLLALDL